MTPTPSPAGPPAASPAPRPKAESLDEAVQAFAALLLASLRNALIYAPTHSQFQLAVSKAEEMAGVAARFTPEMSFICLEKELFVGGKPMNKRGMHFQRLADFMHSLGVQRLTVLSGLTAEELKSFALNLVGLTETGASTGKKVLRATPHIRVARLARQDTDEEGGLQAPVYDLDEAFTAVAGTEGGGSGAGGTGGGPSGSRGTGPGVGSVGGAAGGPGSSGGPGAGAPGGVGGATGPGTGAGPAPTKAQVEAAIRSAARELTACETTLKLVVDLARRAGYLALLGALRQHHEPTYLHSINVALLVAAHAARLKVPPQLLQDVVVAGLFHDLGKLAMPKPLLAKAGPRSPEEERVYRRHCLAGAQLLTRYPAVQPLAITAALEHHLAADGSGFPEELRVAEPHLFSQLVGLADVYDNARAPKPGQPLPTQSAILQEIEQSPRRFPAALLTGFAETLAAFEPAN